MVAICIATPVLATNRETPCPEGTQRRVVQDSWGGHRGTFCIHPNDREAVSRLISECLNNGGGQATCSSTAMRVFDVR